MGLKNNSMVMLISSLEEGASNLKSLSVELEGLSEDFSNRGINEFSNGVLNLLNLQKFKFSVKSCEMVVYESIEYLMNNLHQLQEIIDVEITLGK